MNDQSLKVIGNTIQMRRKSLGVATTSLAEISGISRVTLYRIERGEPTVAIGHYLNVLDALELRIEIARDEQAADNNSTADVIPCRIDLREYPNLKALAWQLDPELDVSPAAVWDIYLRNRRHLDEDALTDAERFLIAQLKKAFDDV